MKNGRLWPIPLVLAIGLGSMAAAQEVGNAPAQKRAKPNGRAGHYQPPQQRQLDQLISKIRTSQEAGQKYQGRHPMTESERERAREHRIKPEGGADFRDGISGAQSEYAIATDPTGLHVVVGYNLFADDPNGVSSMGVAYSNDGGKTFRDGGFLPSRGDRPLPDGTKAPFPFSDPDVKWVPGGNGCNFVYSSIVEQAFPATGRATGSVFTLGIHRSANCGQSWEGPFEVTSATNPNGLRTGGSALDSADKEFMDVDPDTGRVILSWSNFTSTRFNIDGVEVCTTYSDDVMSGDPPTWSKRAILNKSGSGFATGSVPRFGPKGSGTVYVAYSLATDNLTRNTQVVTSHDGGSTWGFPVNTLPVDFASSDDVLGNDRVNEFPSLAVDTSNGPNRGNLYLVYSNNDLRDGSDVALQTSRDGGLTWSPVTLLNSRPGKDRGQWFPYVAADRQTGRVSVIFYDQSVNTSGDLVQVLMTFSEDGGATWTPPVPLTSRPFHAAYGDDSSAPNLGDYIGAVAQNGTLYAVWAGTPNSVTFTDGQPGLGMSLPTLFFQAFSGPPSPAFDLGAISATGTRVDGYLHRQDTISLRVALRNPITNPATGVGNLTGISAVLSTSTPGGVTVLAGESTYADLAPNASALNDTVFLVALGPEFNAGTPVEFALDIRSANGTTRRLFTLNTGAPEGTVLLSENFNSVAPSSLPAGWSAVHGAGNNTVPWTTAKSFCNASSNGLFHVNADDGRNASNAYRWERALSPVFKVAADAQWVTVDFDICYDTEDDPDFPTIAYDGAFLRITDQTPGHAVRSVNSDAFAESLTTGPSLGYPKHLADDRSAAYFGDTSAWAGDSGGMQHVSIRLPGMAGTTGQLRFEYTQDVSGTCKAVRPDRTACGVLVDNIVVRSVKSN